MSKYNKSKKYWIQLRDDWFDDDAIEWLEEQKNGIEYSLFYIKLMLKSVKTEGFLIRQVGKMLIPYVPETLATLTNTNIDTVIVAMELLTKIGLVEILEDGAIYIKQVKQMTGSITVGAERKRVQRKRQNEIGWTEDGQLSTKDKDKTKDKTKDKDISSNELTSNVVSDSSIFYLEVLDDKLKDVLNADSNFEKSYQRIKNLVKRISTEDVIKINKIDYKAEQVLESFIDIFRRPEIEAGEVINTCIEIVDTNPNIKNKYKYLTSILYNKSKEE